MCIHAVFPHPDEPPETAAAQMRGIGGHPAGQFSGTDASEVELINYVVPGEFPADSEQSTIVMTFEIDQLYVS